MVSIDDGHGGCWALRTQPMRGIVDAQGHVRGCEGPYVKDGVIVQRAIGLTVVPTRRSWAHARGETDVPASREESVH